MADLGGILAGKAFIEIGGEIKGLEDALGLAESKVKGFGLKIAGIGAAFFGVGAAIAGGLVEATKEFVAAGSAIADVANRIGMSTKALEEFSFAAKLTGAEMGDVAGAFRGIAKLMGGAVAGSPQAEAINALGLSISDLAAMNPEEKFLALGDGISKIENPTKRAELAMKAFGKAGMTLIPMFADGRAGVEEMTKEFDKLHGAVDVGLADLMGDNVDRMKTSFEGLTAVIGEQMVPVLAPFVERITGVAVAFRELITTNKSIIPGLWQLGSVFMKIGAVLVGVGALIIGVAYGPFLAAVTMWGAIGIAITSVADAVIAYFGGTFQFGIGTALNDATDSFTIFGETLKGWFQWMVDIISTGCAVIGETLTKGLSKAFNMAQDSTQGAFNYFVFLKENGRAPTQAEREEMSNKNYTARDRGIVSHTLQNSAEWWGGLSNKWADQTNANSARRAAENAGKPSIGGIFDTLKEALSSRFHMDWKPDVPKLPGEGEGIPAKQTTSAFGFFGGARMAEMMGVSSVDEEMLSESRKQTSLLQKLVEKKSTGKATYA